MGRREGRDEGRGGGEEMEGEEVGEGREVGGGGGRWVTHRAMASKHFLR